MAAIRRIIAVCRCVGELARGGIRRVVVDPFRPRRRSALMDRRCGLTQNSFRASLDSITREAWQSSTYHSASPDTWSICQDVRRPAFRPRLWIRREKQSRPASTARPGPGENDVTGYASLARGGDILFHEICRERDLRTVIVLPFPPAQFLRSSVEGAEGDWPRRFENLWNETPPSCRHVLDLPQSDEAYGICNRRILDLAREGGEVRLIALWDGGGGDGPGGTADLLKRAEALSGRKPR